MVWNIGFGEKIGDFGFKFSSKSNPSHEIKGFLLHLLCFRFFLTTTLCVALIFIRHQCALPFLNYTF